MMEQHLLFCAFYDCCNMIFLTLTWHTSRCYRSNNTWADDKQQTITTAVHPNGYLTGPWHALRQWLYSQFWHYVCTGATIWIQPATFAQYISAAGLPHSEGLWFSAASATYLLRGHVWGIHNISTEPPFPEIYGRWRLFARLQCISTPARLNATKNIHVGRVCTSTKSYLFP